jgi:hypothetical protein
VGNIQLFTASWTGADTWCCASYGLAFLPGPPGAFADALGASLDRMTVAMAGPSGSESGGLIIRALRVRGAATSGLVQAWVALLTAEQATYYEPPQPWAGDTWTRTIGGKSVTVVQDVDAPLPSDALEFLYAHGDVLYVVVDPGYDPWTPLSSTPPVDPTPLEIEAIAALP